MGMRAHIAFISALGEADPGALTAAAKRPLGSKFGSVRRRTRLSEHQRGGPT